ncbi:MAG: hypothetical protein ACI8TP_005328 [Acidimicrobiales bacterium]|jgi:hypothetical protein
MPRTERLTPSVKRSLRSGKSLQKLASSCADSNHWTARTQMELRVSTRGSLSGSRSPIPATVELSPRTIPCCSGSRMSYGLVWLTLHVRCSRSDASSFPRSHVLVVSGRVA